MWKSWCLMIATMLFAGMFQCATAASSQDDFLEFRREMLSFFAPLHLIPVLSPSGEEVGHIFDAKTLTLLASASECFPTLPSPTRSTASLPEVRFGPSLSGHLEFGVPALVNIDVGGRRLRATRITFTDAYLLQVSQVAFQRAYTPKRCPQFKDIVEGRYVSGATSVLPLVIGTVYYAKKDIELIADDKASAGAAANDLSKIIQKLSLRLTASVKATVQNDNVVEVHSMEPVAIAVRPAFIPTQYEATTLGSGEGASIKGATWRPFEPNLPSNADAFSGLLNTMVCTDIRCFTQER